MNFLPEEIDDYVCNHSDKESNVLQKLNRETWEKVINPRMLSGHLQGRVLSMLSHMIKPKHILEIGTYTGYSAISLAEGLQENGSIDTIDNNEELQPMVKKYILESNNRDRIFCHIGKALEIMPTLSKKFDIVFIDADKENYINYYNLIFEKVNINGYIIVDNVLWSGKVLQNEFNEDLDTKTIKEFNQLVQNDNRVQNVLFPIRDGLMIIRRIS